MLSRPNPDLYRGVEGYMVNTGLSPAAARHVDDLQRALSAVAPGLLWFPPPGALHVTLLDWIAPLADYRERRSDLFARIRPTLDACLRPLVERCPPIEVRFRELVVGADAIILKGTDDGSFGRIRDGFLAGAVLHPQTKRPPRIVHASIARYRDERDIDELAVRAAAIPVDITERITAFRLVRENRIPMIDFDLLGSYHLRGRADRTIMNGGAGD